MIRLALTGLIWTAITVAWVVLWASCARAHDHWINNPAYKGTDGLHCCGADDCMEIPAASALPNADGQSYRTPMGSVANRGVYISEDGKAWICRFKPGPPKCLFVPMGG